MTAEKTNRIMEDRRLEATARLLDVMTTLRRECPWDREQTFDSLRSNTIEETYELADAITCLLYTSPSPRDRG